MAPKLPVVCHSYVIPMLLRCSLMSFLCSHMPFVCNLYVLARHSYATYMKHCVKLYRKIRVRENKYSGIFCAVYSYFICMPFVCARMAPYVTFMYLYVIRISLVCIHMSFVCVASTRMSFVCHLYILVCVFTIDHCVVTKILSFFSMHHEKKI